VERRVFAVTEPVHADGRPSINAVALAGSVNSGVGDDRVRGTAGHERVGTGAGGDVGDAVDSTVPAQAALLPAREMSVQTSPSEECRIQPLPANALPTATNPLAVPFV
jgi:hypothetical protein